MMQCVLALGSSLSSPHDRRYGSLTSSISSPLTTCRTGSRGGRALNRSRYRGAGRVRIQRAGSEWSSPLGPLGPFVVTHYLPRPLKGFFRRALSPARDVVRVIRDRFAVGRDFPASMAV